TRRISSRARTERAGHRVELESECGGSRCNAGKRRDRFAARLSADRTRREGEDLPPARCGAGRGIARRDARVEPGVDGAHSGGGTWPNRFAPVVDARRSLPRPRRHISGEKVTGLAEVAAFLDELLQIAGVPDYPGALNGVQLANRGEIDRVATAVDFSSATIRGAIESRARLILVHHGMFWGGPQPIVGHRYQRIRA